MLYFLQSPTRARGAARVGDMVTGKDTIPSRTVHSHNFTDHYATVRVRGRAHGQGRQDPNGAIAKLAGLITQNSPKNAALKSPVSKGNSNLRHAKSPYPAPVPAHTSIGMASRPQSAKQRERKRPKIPQRAATALGPLPRQSSLSRRSDYGSDPYESDMDSTRHSRSPSSTRRKNTRSSSLDYAADSGADSEGTGGIGALSRRCVFYLLMLCTV